MFNEIIPHLNRPNVEMQKKKRSTASVPSAHEVNLEDVPVTGQDLNQCKVLEIHKRQDETSTPFYSQRTPHEKRVLQTSSCIID